MEGLSEAALIKSLSPRVMLSNHLLPKGTKMNVNLEDQGRQKVSFSFAQTKKPLQSLFGIPTSPDKSAGEPPSISSPSNADRRGQVTERKPELKLTPAAPASAPALETPSPSVVSLATKLKTDLSKMHFKKQILSVSVTEENSASVRLEAPNSSEVHDLQKAVCRSAAEFSLPHPQSAETICAESPEAKAIPAPQKPPASSGKDSESSASAEGELLGRNASFQSATALPGSESDGDTVPMSSSQKPADSCRKTSSESKNKEVKKSSINTHVEEKDKGSSKRSENHERSSSYSKSDRDSKHAYSRSSRSDKDRRRTRSRSRSRSRGSRTSSSHSRADRSRGDRGSRSERSYYHDSDRRSHRGSPRRDRRRSRSRTDRTRDSSDSEDDHRKARTRVGDSCRASAYSSGYKDSKSSSYSKSEKACKSSDSPHLSEFDKRTQPSKSERTSKRLSDSDFQRKCSPDLDSGYRKYSSHHKSDSHRSSSSSARSQTHEKQQKSSSSDSDPEHKGKYISDKQSGSGESSQARNSTADSKQMTPPRTSVQSSEPDRQSPNESQSADRANLPANAAGACKETPDSQLTGGECNNETFKEKVSSTEKSFLPTMTDTRCLNQVNVTLEIYNHSSEDQPYVNSSPAIFASCSQSLPCGLEKEDVASLPGTASLDKEDTFLAHDAQQGFKPEIIELNIVSTVDVPHGTEVSLKSESSCVESENQVTVKTPLMDAAKKSSGAAKKSRWDIVGQVASDGDNSQRTLCSEGKAAVKKVISVKEIELPHQQGSDNSQKDTETHSKQGMQTEIWKKEVFSEGRLSTHMHRGLHQPSQAGNSSRSWGSSVSPKAHIDNGAATIPFCTGGGDHKGIQDKLSRTDESAELSEASDSDNSEYDSDCGEVNKRLHSVVVVPKNSSLTVDMQDTVASQCTPFTSSEVQNLSVPAHMNAGEVPQQRLGNPSTGFLKTSFTHTHMNDSPFNSVLCQSQSNMIDSTSHSEGSSSISAQACMAGDFGVQGSIAGPAHRGISGQCEQECKHSDTVGRSQNLYSHYQPVPFSNADNSNGKIGFSLGWHFSQPEQPSSTYQQPDSSHGSHFSSTKMTGAFLQQQEHTQGTAPWTHQSLDMQSSRQNFHHMHQQYQETSSVVHPDSLTNDHDDFGTDKRAKMEIVSSGFISQPSDPSSFVQGHEISSNSRGSIVSDPPRDEHYRPHRGRGPPKKRRPEVESDSDNEAEAGPTDKKERLMGISKETQPKTDAHRPSLSLQDFQDAIKWKEHSKSKKMPPYFDLIEENLYLTER